MAAPPPHLERLAEVHDVPVGSMRTAFVVLRSLRHALDRNGGGYYDLVLGDASARIPGKVWGDERAYGELAGGPAGEGAVVKVMFSVGMYRDALQLTVKRLRVLDESDEWNPVSVWGEGWDLVEGLRCKTLVFDIETVPAVDLETAPESVTKAVHRAADRYDGDTSKVMGLSPFYGKVVSIAVGDGEDPDGPVTALVVAPPGREDDAYPEWIRPMTEAQLLRSFWHLADSAEVVVSFNGRGFDVPFVQTRSLIHGVPARVDLMSSPFALRPHLDLYRLLAPNRGNPASASLDVICWSLGIESPKGEMDGSLVAPTYARGDIEMIATYNVGDVRATRSVYRHLREHLLPFRKDW
ncbi:3'-5' exonuclease [Plesiocystis pacifica SIR-1]|uniref:3'-5' exonuclease n=1 Tax=Plesiocystis pacifica SIR-1 TaxID=391625 RepID=A6GIH5_9BACT|nr:ribonuclease H-like domain-containing protein [Plesiocystis pacifica]EDM74338.1 3'-5' exonuclease [Plesiocystis pacifica SIR-1]